MKWLPSYVSQELLRREYEGPTHLLIALADHFEPSFLPENPIIYADIGEQLRRLERWCEAYPRIFNRWRDQEGRPFCHSYFFAAEQYNEALVELLVEHCQAGWGEIEIQLHHGLEKPDTARQTRRVLKHFIDVLASLGCLSRLDGSGPPRYAFVHGNWALANSGGGLFCGVDDEVRVLAETGCYADFTLPSAPSPCQISKINCLYECGMPLHFRAPHRRGRDLRVGCAPQTFPLIVQGPLMLRFDRLGREVLPRIENGALTIKTPPTIARLRLWRRAAITVRGRPEWVFIKLYCHGMDPRDESAMLGQPMQQFLAELEKVSKEESIQVHFLTAREMVNIMLAACDGRSGGPGEYRDYRFKLGSVKITMPGNATSQIEESAFRAR